ncbi:DUF3127 domain-containing protein [Flavilitoribacter nigricans]|uniref:DUF3127 domain-containing protein n=1 Tax=Flavilitoribacter nigricans (strain ATCC 23147 / DSM 23189 / NBRC 102662 / NCIMB 1420 / SS-2) TaxID=1122177 RepID=A0A2D0NI57_FLAN2|nr:DUF3127 domain-containing protein [Flavilitoribacter nigricans]PHN08070.1 hypothetical protein CRP01_03380 [Flavilitoribacter nigricans DSM 23189 = NBRC 102662]
MSFEVEGTLHKKFDTENKTGTFQAREFVIEVADGNYPQLVKFQLVQDRCALLDPFQENEKIKVHFDLRGREWNGKYFTNLNAWRLEKVEMTASTASAPPDFSDDSFPSAGDEPQAGGDFDDDLPF